MWIDDCDVSSRLGRKEDDRELAELKRHEIEKKKRKLN